jgi:hypothetical protein
VFVARARVRQADISTFREFPKRRNDLGTSLFLLSARFGSVQDSHPYEFLVAISQQDTLVSEKFRVRGFLGSLEADVENIGFFVVVDPSLTPRQPNEVR